MSGYYYYSHREREINVTTLEANVQHLKSSTRYMFRVYAYNSHGFSQDAARLIVETQPEGWFIGY